MADDDGVVEVELLQNSYDVTGQLGQAVSLCPSDTQPVATLIKGDDAELVTEIAQLVVPDLRRKSDAVQEDQRSSTGAAPLDQMEISSVVAGHRGVDDVVELVETLVGRLVDALRFVAQVAPGRQRGTGAGQGSTGSRDGAGEEK